MDMKNGMAAAAAGSASDGLASAASGRRKADEIISHRLFNYWEYSLI